MMENNKTRRLTLMAMFAALAYILVSVGRIPISSVPFLKYDPKDVAIVISGFVMGPGPALLVSLVVSLVEMVTISATGVIGMFMNLLSSGLFACTAAGIYRKKHSLWGAGAGLVVATLLTTCAMLLWNYFITPIYMGYPREAIAAMLVPVFLPFNLIKCGLNAAITVLVYKPVSRALKRAKLVEGKPGSTAAKKKGAMGAMIIAALVIVSCVVAILVIKGII